MSVRVRLWGCETLELFRVLTFEGSKQWKVREASFVIVMLVTLRYIIYIYIYIYTYTHIHTYTHTHKQVRSFLVIHESLSFQ